MATSAALLTLSSPTVAWDSSSTSYSLRHSSFRPCYHEVYKFIVAVTICCCLSKAMEAPLPGGSRSIAREGGRCLGWSCCVVQQQMEEKHNDVKELRVGPGRRRSRGREELTRRENQGGPGKEGGAEEDLARTGVYCKGSPKLHAHQLSGKDLAGAVVIAALLWSPHPPPTCSAPLWVASTPRR